MNIVRSVQRTFVRDVWRREAHGHFIATQRVAVDKISLASLGGVGGVGYD